MRFRIILECDATLVSERDEGNITVTEDQLVEGIVCNEHPTVDGFEVVAEIDGIDSTQDFFLSNGTIKKVQVL